MAAVNGTAAGGGYEIALACDEIVLIDDGSSTVSLPEVPLLGVLPGTGGLTRVVDKRHVRKDRADLFATKAEGFRGQTAVDWGLVDSTAPRNRFAEHVAERARVLAEGSSRPGGPGVALTPLDRTEADDAISYSHVTATIDRAARRVDIEVRGPETDPPADADGVRALGVDWWPMAVTRELDDLVLRLRTNETGIGTWVFRTSGDTDRVLAHDAQLADLRRLVRHRGPALLEAHPQAPRRHQPQPDRRDRAGLVLRRDAGRARPGVRPAVHARRRLRGRRPGRRARHDRADRGQRRRVPDGQRAQPPGVAVLGTRRRAGRRSQGDRRAPRRPRGRRARPGHLALDDLDLEDELRIALEERASLSPDALTGMEANHRFVGPETVESKIFGRLTAWQNWIFYRPNASGPDGALRRYGSGQRGSYDYQRV